MTLFLRRRITFSSAVQQTHGDVLRISGHDYLCELTVRGPIDPATGMVVNIRDVDAVLQSCIKAPLQGKLLNRDVAAFRDVPPSAENLARFAWGECRFALPQPAQISRATIWQDRNVWATVSAEEPGNAPPMLTITCAYDFSASHRLHSDQLSDQENAEIFGKCNWPNGHGHNYEIELTLSGEPDLKSGQLISLDLLNRVVDEEILTPFDHKHLNYDVPEFRDLNPTSENLTRVIWDKLAQRFAGMNIDGARLYKVAVRETARNYFEYYGEQPE